jgi:hypothetical protein
MQYKSARPCFSIFSKKTFLGAIASVALLVPMIASATLTVTPISKIPQYFGQTLNNSFSSAFYYPIYVDTAMDNGLTSGATGIAKIGIIDPLFSFLDLGQDPNPAGDMTTQDGVIIFNVLATSAVTGQAVLTATMATANGGAAAFVPIVGWGVNNVMTGCYGSSGCLPQGAVANHTSNPLYYGVYYTPNQTFQIAISPTAFCESFALTSQTNSYCTGSFFSNSGTGGPSQTMDFNFVVFPSSALPAGPNIANTTVVPTTGSTDTTEVNLTFVALNPQPVTSASPIPSPSASPTMACILNEEGIYAPAQQGFTLQAPQNFTLVNDPTSTIQQLVVVAVPSPGPLNASVNNYTTNGSVSETIDGITVSGFADPPSPWAVNQYFGGFTNSTSTAAFYYDVGFLAEDPAGYVIDDGGSGVCTFPGVFSTSAVQGFLKQSKCFIATAAFRDLNTAPLVLLRSFRDHFLENFSLGRSFVHWYYAWSPDAAEWLIDHPVFRFPVLLALIPLQAFAWLVLHPMMMVVLMLMGASLVLWGTLFRRSTE